MKKPAPVRQPRQPTPKVDKKFLTELEKSLSLISGVRSVRYVNDIVMAVSTDDAEYLVNATVAKRYKENIPGPEEFRQWLKDHGKRIVDVTHMTRLGFTTVARYLKPVGSKNHRKMSYPVWFTIHYEVTGRKPYEEK